MWFKQSTAVSIIVGPILDSAGVEYASAVIGDLSHSKNGGTLTALASTATLTYIANGYYTLALNTTNTNTLGQIDITCNKSTYQMPPRSYMVLPATVYDALTTNAVGAANGFLLCGGSNAGTTTFGALTVTGAATISGGLSITQSTTDGNGITVTGNGAGAGVRVNGGSSSGHGVHVVGGSSDGNALHIIAAGSGVGVNAVGGTTGTGLRVSGGTTSGIGISVLSNGGNSVAVNLAGNGSGAGLRTVGGATGVGALVVGGSTSGAGLSVTTTNGDGVSVTPTAGSALVLTGNGTSKHGAVLTGGTAGTSDGVSFVAGTGGVGLRAGTMTVTGATVYTGNVSMAAGLTVTQSSSNASGITVTGNGTGHGVIFTSGSGATGDGFRTVAASTNGAGYQTTGAGTGDGLAATAGATGRGIHALGGATSGDGFQAEAATSGNGIRCVGATNGHGIYAFSGVGSGHGMSLQASGSGDALALLPLGAGVGIRSDSVTVTNALTVSGSTTFTGAWTATNGSNNVTGVSANVVEWDGAAVATPATTGVPKVNVVAIDNQNVNASASITFPTSIGTSTLTQTDITGGSYSIQSSSCVLGDARIANLDATVTSRSSHSASDAATAVWGAGTRTLTSAGSSDVNVVTWDGVSVTGMPLPTGSYTAPPSLADIWTYVSRTLTSSSDPTAADIADAVWDEALSGHAVSGSTGEALDAAGTAGDPWTTALPGSYTAGQAGYILGTNLNATVTSRMATYTQPTGFLAATFPATVASTTNITAGTITTVTNLTNAPSAGDFTATMKASIGTAVAASAVASVTGSVGSVGAGGITRSSLAVDTGLQSVRSNTAQAGDWVEITLDAGASATSNIYRNCVAYLTGGTGAGQYRLVTAYNGTTKVATVTPAWIVPPDNTSTFALLPHGMADVFAWTSAAVAAPDTAGYPKVTLKTGTGTGEVSLSSGVVSANMTAIAGAPTAVDTGTAGTVSFVSDAYVATAGSLVPANVTQINGENVADDGNGHLRVVLADAVNHGGNSATLQLGSNSGYALFVQSSAPGFAGAFFGGGAGGAGVYTLGGDGGAGLWSVGQGTGPGLLAQSAGTHGAKFESTGNNGHGLWVEGDGNGNGFTAVGGPNGPGGLFLGGSSSGGDGLQAISGGNGIGFKIAGAGEHHDISLDGTGVIQGDLYGRVLGGTSTDFVGVGVRAVAGNGDDLATDAVVNSIYNVVADGTYGNNAIKTELDAVKTVTDALSPRLPGTGTISTHTAADVWSSVSRTLTDGTTVGQYVWAALTSATTTPGSFGKLLKDNINTTLSGIATNATTAAGASISAATGVSALTTTIGTPAGASVSADIAAVQAKTVNLPASPAAVGSAMTLTSAYDAAKTALTVSGYTAPPSAASVAVAVVDQTLSGHTTAGTVGAALEDAAAGGSSITAEDVWTYSTRTITAGGGASVEDIAEAVWTADDRTLTQSVEAEVDPAAIAAAIELVSIATGLTPGRILDPDGNALTTLNLKQAFALLMAATFGDRTGLGTRRIVAQIPGDVASVQVDRISRSDIESTLTVPVS